jgi:ADP-dependent NAD(P)H-hydrate dehydratase / NAD(P)H-hydrate epimerase
MSLAMAGEILTVAEMYAADTFAAGSGVPSLILMENAGRAVAEEILRRWPKRQTLVLCGSGNNGGDGYVTARYLSAQGWSVRVAHHGLPKGGAAEMAKRWDRPSVPLETVALDGAELVVDAMFGAGLSRPLEEDCSDVATALNRSSIPVVAIDVPSGLHGDLARPLGEVCVDAELTVTFFRKKPAHVLMPGALSCGSVVVADIGIPEEALETISPKLLENGPSCWQYPWPPRLGHKYARGHCVVVSGSAQMTGAARLAARGALRSGAGLVSVASPRDAVAVNAMALTAIMVKPFSGGVGLSELLNDKRLNAVVIGPGCGVGIATRELVTAVLASGASAVLDADALTSFAQDRKALFRLLREPAVLTPHEGEFGRLFPGLLQRSANKVEAARAAAASARCTVLFKGPDTVIAAPDGRAIINTNAPPELATAGAGDVLAGMIGGLMAQGVDSFASAAMGAWLHGEAASRVGPGLISEDLPEQLPAVLRILRDDDERHSDPARPGT